MTRTELSPPQYMVKLWPAASYSTFAARGSIGTPVTRLIQVSSFTTCGARAIAASVAAKSPIPASTNTLFGPSHTSGALGANASSVAVTEGSGS